MKNSTYNKGFIGTIIILIIAVLAVGGGVYVANKNKKAKQVSVENSTEATTTVEMSGTPEANASTQITLRGLLGLNKTVMCTIKSTNSSGSTSGTVYISGTMMHGDFVMVNGSNSTESHMIRNNDDMYVWSGTQGAKMNMENMETAMNTHTEGTAKTNVNLDEKVDYKCSDWTKDDSKFVAPTTVKFVDLNAMMKMNGNVKLPVNIQ